MQRSLSTRKFLPFITSSRHIHHHLQVVGMPTTTVCPWHACIRQRRLSTASTTTLHYDVLIVGGGVVGATLAKCLSERLTKTTGGMSMQHGPLRIGVLERGPGPTSASSSSSSSSSSSTAAIHKQESSTTPSTSTTSTSTSTSTSTTTPPRSSSSLVPHPRSYALSPKSLCLLGPRITTQLISNNNNNDTPGGRYNSMQVWEQDSPAMLLFTKRDLVTNNSPTNNNNNNNKNHTSDEFGLGCVVEDQALVTALWDQLDHNRTNSNSNTQQNTTFYRHAEIQDIDFHDEEPPSSENAQGLVRVSVRLPKEQCKHEGTANTTTNTTTTKSFTTHLLVAADGANSFVRSHLGIPWTGFDYDNRTALTCTVKLQSPMPQRAFQRFLPTGPMAMLPTWDAHFATIVWSTTSEQAQYYQNKAKESDLVHGINTILQQGPQRLPPLFRRRDNDSSAVPSLLSNLLYGADKVLETLQYGLTMAHWTDYQDSFVAPPLIHSVASPTVAVPLSCRHAAQYVSHQNRVVLVGDAAHTVHPMAGQGLNMGLADVQVLTDALCLAQHSGMALTTFCNSHYGIPQHAVNAVTQRGIHALHELFVTTSGGSSETTGSCGDSSSSHVKRHVKSLGMHAVNMLSPVRRPLAQVAAGGFPMIL